MMRGARRRVLLLVVGSIYLLVSLGQYWLLWRRQDIAPSSQHQAVKVHLNDFKENRKPLVPAQPSRWAYAFLIAGCHSEMPQASYRGMLFNVLVATYNLKTTGGSQADVVVMIQMHPNSPRKVLWEDDVQALTSLGIVLVYLDTPSPTNSFYQVQMEKFRILTLTNYTRVLYLDADVMPFCSLDFLFAAASALLAPSVLLAWLSEPAHGGFFMLTPNQTDYDLLQSILRKRHEQVTHLKRHRQPLWNETTGWGVPLYQAGRDDWYCLRTFRQGHYSPCGHTWSWYGDFADQGLLYYFAKYIKQDVSILVGPHVQHWKPAANDSTYPRLVRTDENVFVDKTCLPPGKEYKGNYGHNRGFFHRRPVYRDFIHFTGDEKPWLQAKVPRTIWRTNKYQSKDATEFWFHTLKEIKEIYNLSVIPPLHKIKDFSSAYGGIVSRHMIPTIRGDRNKTT